MASVIMRHTDVDQNDVFSDFDDLFKVDEQSVFSATPRFAVGGDDAQPFIFGIAQHDVAHFAQLFAVLGVDDFFGAQRRKRDFHNFTSLLILYANRQRKGAKI